MTMSGKILDRFGQYLPEKMESRLWDMASKRFAKSAKSSVEVFQIGDGIGISSTWSRIEYRQLAERKININYNIIP